VALYAGMAFLISRNKKKEDAGHHAGEEK